MEDRGNMDPMDFTMDHEDAHQQAQNPPQCQRYQPNFASSTDFPSRTPFSNMSREAAHIYDPINNTDWYGPGHNFGGQGWGTSFGPPWTNSFGGEAPNAPQGGESSAYRPYMGGFNNQIENEARQMQGHTRRNRMPASASSAGTGIATIDTSSQANHQSDSPTAAATDSPARSYAYYHTMHGDPDFASNLFTERARAYASRSTRASELSPYASRRTVGLAASPDSGRWNGEDEDEVLSMSLASLSPAERAEMLSQYQRVLEGRPYFARAVKKSVPSKAALESLEKIEISEVDDKCCSICYDEIGITNPDGVLEHPIRLPKCKHVFGNKCLDTWFKDNDTCPYCRDKLPSEPIKPRAIATDHYRSIRERHLSVERSRRFIAAASSSSSASASASASAPDEFPENYARGSRYSADDYRSMRIANEFNSQIEPLATTPPSSRSVAGRDVPEHRRRPNRGRASFNLQTPHMHTWRNAPNPQSTTQRSYQGLATSTIGRACPRPRTPSQNSSPEASPSPNGSNVSEQASPAVAIGSGIGSQRPASFSDPSQRNDTDVLFPGHPHNQWRTSNHYQGGYQGSTLGFYERRLPQIGRNSHHDMAHGRSTGHVSTSSSENATGSGFTTDDYYSEY